MDHNRGSVVISYHPQPLVVDDARLLDGRCAHVCRSDGRRRGHDLSCPPPPRAKGLLDIFA